MTADTRQDDTRRAFDDAATDFTALGHHLWNPIGAATVAAARLGPGDRVLDSLHAEGITEFDATTLIGTGLSPTG
jgi:hypothetical protein